MKKLALLLILLFITGCGQQNADILKVGVVPGPQAEIVKQVQKLGQQENFSFEIIEFKDYVEINSALKQGKIDLNCFQHQLYLDQVNKERQTDFVPVGKTVLPRLGLYSAKYTSLGALPDGATIAVADDLLTTARSLWLLEREGLITLKKIARLPDLSDITANPRNFKLAPTDSSRIREGLPQNDAALLTPNYAASICLKPGQALLLEDASARFTQLIVTRAASKDDPRIRKFVKIYQSPEIKNFIQNIWAGQLLPVW